MGPTKRITVSLPEDIVRAADKLAARCGRFALAADPDALEWHLRAQELPIEEPNPE
jgi:hypothetical protein